MKDLGNYECEGQMSLKDLMDLIAPVVVDNEPPILLSEGQTVYKVVRGDVEECIAREEHGFAAKIIEAMTSIKVWHGIHRLTRLYLLIWKQQSRVAERYLAEHEHVLGKVFGQLKLWHTVYVQWS